MNFAEMMAARNAQMELKNRPKLEKIQDGSSTFRIMPSWRKNGDNQFYHDFGAHYLTVGDQKAGYLCVHRTFGENCPICAGIASALGNVRGDEQAVGILEKAKASSRVLLNMFRIGGPQEKAKPMTYEVPASVFDDMFKYIYQYMQAGQNIIDSRDPTYAAVNFVIQKSGSGKNTRYTVMAMPSADRTPVEWFANLPDIDSYLDLERKSDSSRFNGLLQLAASPAAGALPGLAAPAAFGQPALPAESAFGQPAAGFGQPAAQPAGFGQPAAGFGQPAAGFGQPAAGFGQPVTQPAGFGQPAAQPAAQPAGFGQPVAQPAGFGQPVAQPAGFGQPAAQPAGFGQPAASAFDAQDAALRTVELQSQQAAAFGQPAAGFGQPVVQNAGINTDAILASITVGQ